MQHLAASNQRVAALRKLIRSRKARHDEQLFVVDGPRALSTLVDTEAQIEAVFVDSPDRAGELPSSLDPDIDVFDLDRSVFESVADSKTPQGVMALVAFDPCSVDDVLEHRRIVVLDGVQDPGNVGAVVRVAAGLGWDAVVACRGSGDPWSPKAVRASAGTVGMVDVVVDVDASDTVDGLSRAGVRCVGADMSPSLALDVIG